MVRYTEERMGGDYNTQDREGFNRTVQELKLIDIQTIDRRFTWSNLRENPSLTKQDIIMIQSNQASRYPFCTATTGNRLT